MNAPHRMTDHEFYACEVPVGVALVEWVMSPLRAIALRAPRLAVLGDRSPTSGLRASRAIAIACVALCIFCAVYFAWQFVR